MYDFLLPDTLATTSLWLVGLTAVVLVLVDAFSNDARSIPVLAALGLGVALGLEVMKLGDPAQAVFHGQIVVGGLSSYFSAVILLGALVTLILAVPYLRHIQHHYGEVYVLLLVATCGMQVLASAGSLITVFVGLETMSVCLYVLAGLVREDRRATESALKYFLLGAFATGFFLYGIALLYGATGTMVLADMPSALAATGRTGLFLGGLGLLFVGFFFKVSAVPFHMWTPDVYQGAPTPLTGFMSTASKAAAFAALILVLMALVPASGFAPRVGLVLAVIAALTMVAGNVLALQQTNAKRMLAYSSVAHAGYILAGLAAGSAAGYAGALYYLLAYTLMNLGAFGVLALLESDDAQGAQQPIDALAGMGFRKPLLGVTMGVFLFGLTGFPPLAGFIGKWQVFAAAVEGGLTWLAVVGVLASAASAVYYLRVLAVLWMRDPHTEPAAAQRATFPVPLSVAAVLVACAVALFALGVLPGTVLNLTQALVQGGALALGF